MDKERQPSGAEATANLRQKLLSQRSSEIAEEAGVTAQLIAVEAPQCGGVKDLLLLDKEEQKSVGKGCYEYMFAIRLPETAKAKKKEQQAFEEYKKIHCEGKGKTMDSLLHDLVVLDNQKQSSSKQDGTTTDEIQCDETLEGTLNCVIGMILSFFETLSVSHEGPFEILKFNSVEVNKVFICTRMSPKLAEALADMAEYSVQLSEAGLAKLDIKIEDTQDLVPAFVKYDKDQKTNGFLKVHTRADKPNEQTVLNHIDRMRLFYDKVTDHFRVWDLAQMLQPLNITMKMFPIHDEEEILKLKSSWANWKMYFVPSQPIQDVRDYYGEEIAFYFLFTETMRKGLLVLFVITLLFWNRWTEWALPYSVAIVAWFACLDKYWKRLEVEMANRWGSDYTHTNAAVKDLVNPDFDGPELPSDVDENLFEKRADPWKQTKGKAISVLVGTLFILLVTGGVVLNRWAITVGWISRTTGNLLVTVQIRIFGTIWENVVPVLSAGEEHVTMQALGQSNAMKTFIFLFFNTFQAFLWIAYVSPSYDPQGCLAPGLKNGCRTILYNSLVQAFPMLVLFAAVGLLGPFINIWKKYRKQANDLEELRKAGKSLPAYTISSMEMQTKMLDFGAAEIAEDYMQVISTIAFVCMWVVVAPLVTTIMGYVAISVQHGVDAYRLTMLYQRPFPTRVASIGIWNNVMTFLKYASITNLAGLLVTNPQVDIAGDFGLIPSECHLFAYGQNRSNTTLFNSEIADSSLPPQCTMTTQANVLVFFVVLVLLCGSLAAFDALVPNESTKTTLNKKRQIYQRAKMFEMDLQEFNENCRLTGHSDWQKSKYHAPEVTPQLKPEDPLYVKCVTIGA